MPGPRSTPEPHPAPDAVPDTARDVIRWAAFGCAVVPAVLVGGCGVPVTTAAGVALGLAGVTGVCGVLLRHSARCAAAAGPPGGGGHITGGAEPRTPVD